MLEQAAQGLNACARLFRAAVHELEKFVVFAENLLQVKHSNYLSPISNLVVTRFTVTFLLRNCYGLVTTAGGVGGLTENSMVIGSCRINSKSTEEPGFRSGRTYRYCFSNSLRRTPSPTRAVASR